MQQGSLERELTWIRLVPTRSEGGDVLEAVVKYGCNWQNCQDIFDSVLQLREHILGFHGTQESNVCRVSGCMFEIGDPSCLRRHLYFHCYHADRENAGLQLLINDKRTTDVRHCYTSSVEGARPNAVAYSGHILGCGWDKCDKHFDDVLLYGLHIDKHAKDELSYVKVGPKKFKCQWKAVIRGLMNDNTDSISAETRTESDDSDCTHESGSKSTLRTHARHHSGDKPFSCPFCGAFFANATKLIDHVLRKSASQGSRLKCFYCQKQFPNERLLREHGRRHVKNYKCPFCDMTVETPSEVRSHIESRHSTLKHYLCTICGKKFKKAYDLSRHFSSHSDSNMFECSECEKSFKWKRSLNEHIKLHDESSDKWPFVCHLCPQKYRTGATLSHHLTRIHRVELPSGHSRFQYKKCADGYLRLQTERYESNELAQAFREIEKERAAGISQPNIIPVSFVEENETTTAAQLKRAQVIHIEMEAASMFIKEQTTERSGHVESNEKVVLMNNL